MNEIRAPANSFLDGQSPSASLPSTRLVDPKLAVGSRLSGLDSKGQQRDEEKDTDIHEILNAWFHEHKEFPYPSQDEKNLLSTRTGLDMIQIESWFANARAFLNQSSVLNYPFSLNNSVAHKLAIPIEERFRGSQ